MDINQFANKISPEAVSTSIGVVLGFTLERFSRYRSERAENRRILHRAFNEIGDNHIFCRLVKEGGFKNKVRHLEIDSLNRLMECDQFFDLGRELQQDLRNFHACALTFNAEVDDLKNFRAAGNYQSESDLATNLQDACAAFEPELHSILVSIDPEIRRLYWMKVLIEEKIRPMIARFRPEL